MALPARVVVHIGGSKTASTSLQKGVFLNAPGTHHFGEYGDGVTTLDEEQVVRSIFEVDDAFYDSLAVDRLFTEHLGRAERGTLVFSSADVLHANQPSRAAKRLRGVIGSGADVLLVVRDQRSALASYYAGHGAWLKPAPRPYFRAFVGFDDWLDYQWLLLPDSRIRTFSYWEQLAPFIDAFGHDRVRVVCFEDLVRGDLETWKKVGALVGVDAQDAFNLFSAEHQRERITKWQLRFGRAMRMLLPFVATPDVRDVRGRTGAALRGGSKFVPTWAPAQLERLATYYAAGNAELEKAFGLRLHALRYPGCT